MRKLFCLPILLVLANRSVAQMNEPLRLIREDVSLLQPPAVHPAADFESDDPRIRALFFEGKPYKGKPTRVFAWMGIPQVEFGKKVPGMVLIHGGGGTAFDRWVKVWLDRGYAAIAMDTCGQVPAGAYNKWKRHENAGPLGWGASFNQVDEPLIDQWQYHALCDVLLSHSLLRSQEGVDADRIGATGISWGGYLMCLVAGADPRLKFAAPVYGCGFIDLCTWGPTQQKADAKKFARWLELWDPQHWLPQAPVPMLWVTGTNDFAYPFNALQKSYRLPKTPRTLAIRLRMPHGHGPPGENPPEILAFADSIVRGGVPLTRITGQGRDGSTAWATFETAREVADAELLYTKDTGLWQKRKWETCQATVVGSKVTATIPEGATVYYLNLIDSGKNVVSTEHVEMKKEGT